MGWFKDKIYRIVCQVFEDRMEEEFNKRFYIYLTENKAFDFAARATFTQDEFNILFNPAKYNGAKEYIAQCATERLMDFFPLACRLSKDTALDVSPRPMLLLRSFQYSAPSHTLYGLLVGLNLGTTWKIFDQSSGCFKEFNTSVPFLVRYSKSLSEDSELAIFDPKDETQVLDLYFLL